MEHLGIYSPNFGLRKDIPSVLLNKVFHPDNSNIQFWDGRIRSAKMRVKELQELEYSTGTVDATSGDATVVGSGTAWHAGLVGRAITISGDAYEIDSVTSGTSIELTQAYTGAYGGGGVSYTIGTIGTKVPTPDGNPVLKYFNHITDTGTEILLSFTAENVYRWDTATYSWYLMYDCSTCTQWVVENFEGGVAATNNVDKPLFWDGDTANTFVFLGDPVNGPEVSTGVYITRAKALAVFENHVLLGNVTLSDGSFLPNQIYGSDLDEVQEDSSTPWIPSSGSDAFVGFCPGKGTIVSFGIKGDFLYVFKEDSIRAYWYSGTSAIYNSRNHSAKIGCRSYDSIVQMPGDPIDRLYYYSSNLQFREIDEGPISQFIEPDTRNINQGASLLVGMKAAYIAEYDEVWWSVPYGAGATANNKVYCMQMIKPGLYRWYTRDMTVTAFGTYNRKSAYTWDTLPFDSWDEWGWDSWDNPESQEGYPVDLCSDADGNTYAAHNADQDDTSAITSYFVLSTDLTDKQSLRYYKRMLGLHFYYDNAVSGTATIYIKRDNEVSWQNAGTVNMFGDEDIVISYLDPDYRAKSFLIKIESTNPYRFLGMEIDYIVVGER